MTAVEVDGAAVSVKHGLVHRLRQGRMREDRANEFGLGGLQGLGDRVALDQLGDLGADHVRAQKLTGLAVEDRLDHTLGLTERDRLAIADKREMADFDLVASFSRALLGQADPRNLGPAIGASRDVVKIERVNVVYAGDPFDTDAPLVARLMR